MDALREALRAEPPPGCEKLSAADADAVAALIRSAREQQGAELRAAVDGAYDHVPRLLRGPLRRLLGG
jgi:hypothetical protein